MAVRVAVGDPKAISVQFPGTATGDVEVTVVSARDGATAGPFTASSIGSGVYAYTLDASMVEQVDELMVSFTGTVTGVEYTRTEVVQVAGAYYFTVAEARALGPIDASFTDEEIEKQRMAVEDQIEANCDTHFVARFVSESLSGGGEPFLRLTENYILNLIAVTVDSEDVTSSVSLDGRYLWAGTIWTPGHRNVVAKYESGYQNFPPEDLRRKAIEATRYNLLREKRKGLPNQAVTLGTEIGNLRLAIANLRSPFGYPEVDAVVARWALRVGVPVAGA